MTRYPGLTASNGMTFCPATAPVEDSFRTTKLSNANSVKCVVNVNDSLQDALKPCFACFVSKDLQSADIPCNATCTSGLDTDLFVFNKK